jgi:hypothetical protein
MADEQLMIRKVLQFSTFQRAIGTVRDVQNMRYILSIGRLHPTGHIRDDLYLRLQPNGDLLLTLSRARPLFSDGERQLTSIVLRSDLTVLI